MADYIELYYNQVPVPIRNGKNNWVLYFKTNIDYDCRPALILSLGRGNTNYSEKGLLAVPSDYNGGGGYLKYSHSKDGISFESWGNASFGNMIYSEDTFRLWEVELGQSTNYYSSFGGVLCNELTLEEAKLVCQNYYGSGTRYPITYRPTNCSFPNAPTEAAVGDTVVVPVTFPEGYGLANPNDLFVQCNGVLVPSTYENGQLTFTMPDPS